MGSTRKKIGGKKKTLKYGGGRNNYKKGSFKNRRKMTIRNGEGLKGGMYRFKDENNFKKTDSEDTIRYKLTRMYTRKIGEPSKLRDYMEESWKKYLSSISPEKRKEMEALAHTVTSAGWVLMVVCGDTVSGADEDVILPAEQLLPINTRYLFPFWLPVTAFMFRVEFVSPLMLEKVFPPSVLICH